MIVGGVPLLFGGAVAGDPYFADVISLLHFNGNLTDVTGKTWTAAGNAAATGTAKFGSNALALDGSGDAASTPDDSAFRFTGDFTIEAWVYATTLGGYRGFCGHRLADANFGLTFGVNGGGVYVGLSTTGSSWAVNATSADTNAITAGAWHHVALARVGSTVTAYVNGISKLTGTASGALASAAASFYIGQMTGSLTTGWNGRIDDFRITKGIARYTANFTPPTEPFPDA